VSSLPGNDDGSGDARALYQLPPEEFTAARDALVKRLRKAGEREKADEIRRLRRPNAPAWALNQVAQGDPGLIEDVLAAGRELQEAMEVGDGGRLREAERLTRRASDSVVDQAERILAGAGQSISEDSRARMTATLRAAILDPDVAERLRLGTLERDVELAGFGMDLASGAAASPWPRPSAPRPKRTQEDKERLEREREEQRRREEARRAARARLNELENEAERLARRAERLAGVAERAEREALEARADATAAAAEAEEAAARAAEARRQLDEQDALG
jgi:hypothetical protein